MAAISVEYYKTPFGELLIGAFDKKVCICDWVFRKQRNAIDSRIKKHLKVEFVKKKNPY